MNETPPYAAGKVIYAFVIFHNNLFKEEQSYYFKLNYGQNKLTIVWDVIIVQVLRLTKAEVPA